MIVASNNAIAIPKIGDGLLQNPAPVFDPMRRHKMIVESNNAIAIPKVGDGLLQNPAPVFDPMRRHKTETHCAVCSCCD